MLKYFLGCLDIATEEIYEYDDQNYGKDHADILTAMAPRDALVAERDMARAMAVPGAPLHHLHSSTQTWTPPDVAQQPPTNFQTGGTTPPPSQAPREQLTAANMYLPAPMEKDHPIPQRRPGSDVPIAVRHLERAYANHSSNANQIAETLLKHRTFWGETTRLRPQLGAPDRTREKLNNWSYARTRTSIALHRLNPQEYPKESFPLWGEWRDHPTVHQKEIIHRTQYAVYGSYPDFSDQNNTNNRTKDGILQIVIPQHLPPMICPGAHHRKTPGKPPPPRAPPHKPRTQPGKPTTTSRPPRAKAQIPRPARAQPPQTETPTTRAAPFDVSDHQ